MLARVPFDPDETAASNVQTTPPEAPRLETVTMMTCEILEKTKCDGGCNAVAELQPGEARSRGWRTLTIQFEGSPYPEFQGDLCPECVEKAAGTFLRMRPGIEAAALLETAAVGVKEQ